VDEAINDGVAWLCGGVMHVTFHDDVFLGLNFSVTIWIARERWGKNLCLYSPMGTCPVVMQVK